MRPHCLGGRDQMQRLAAMAQLSAWLLAAAVAQALGFAAQAVARRWLATVMAVLGQPRLQGLDLGSQQLYPLAQGSILGFQFGDPLSGGHTPMLHLLCNSA